MWSDKPSAQVIAEMSYNQRAKPLPDIQVRSNIAIQNHETKRWEIYGIVTDHTDFDTLGHEVAMSESDTSLKGAFQCQFHPLIGKDLYTPTSSATQPDYTKTIITSSNHLTPH